MENRTRVTGWIDLSAETSIKLSFTLKTKLQRIYYLVIRIIHWLDFSEVYQGGLKITFIMDFTFFLKYILFMEPKLDEY